MDAVTRAWKRAEDRPEGPEAVYGRGGPMRIESQRDPNVTTSAFLDACRELDGASWRI